MSNGPEDKDVGAAPELENQEDSATPAGVYECVRQRKLTKEESTSHAAVQMLMAKGVEMSREITRLRLVENEYNLLRVSYARLDERVSVIGKASIFWDMVLVLAPLFVGLVIDAQDILSTCNLLVAVPLILFIVAAHVARYGISCKKRDSATKKNLP